MGKVVELKKDTFKVITNNVKRELISWDDLSPEEREDFDYVEKVEGDDYKMYPRFFRYKGNLYDVSDCEVPSHFHFPEWDGAFTETFFSGVLFRYSRYNLEDDMVVVGRYCT